MISQTVYVTGATGFVGSNLLTYLGRNKSRRLITIGRSRSDLTFDDFELEAPQVDSAIIHLAGKSHDLRKVASPQDYDEINFGLTKRMYDRFIESDAAQFILASSVKAVADTVVEDLLESTPPSPGTAYGASKLKAEEYLRNRSKSHIRKTYILRPCMIHGPGNKGNLNLLYGLVSHRIPYPLGAFENQRSLLTIENLCFAIDRILSGRIEPGTYNVADDSPLSTNEMITIMSESMQKKALILSPPRTLMTKLACMGDRLRLPINSERLQKLTESYVVSNAKLLQALDRSSMPVTAPAGLFATALTFHKSSHPAMVSDPGQWP